MILYASLLRLSDGTPLSATSDAANGDSKSQEGRRLVKLLGKQMSRLNKRVCLQCDDITIHGISDECTCCVIVCEANYPHILAYSFLMEIMKEFHLLYTASVVNAVKRPYAFIEFDSFLQKNRQKYNTTRALVTRLNLTDMTTDLNMNPPIYLRPSDLEPPTLKTTQPSVLVTQLAANGHVSNGSVIPQDLKSTVGVSIRLKPIPWCGWFGLVLVVPCIILDAYRGAAAISVSRLEEFEEPSPWHGIFFLMEMFLQLMQVHFLHRYHRLRKVTTLGATVGVTGLNVLLWQVRDLWVVVGYLMASICLLLATFRRPFERCLPRFSV